MHLTDLTKDQLLKYEDLSMRFFSETFMVLKADWAHTLHYLREGDLFDALLDNSPDIDGLNWQNRADLVRAYEALKEFIEKYDLVLTEKIQMSEGLNDNR